MKTNGIVIFNDSYIIIYNGEMSIDFRHEINYLIEHSRFLSNFKSSIFPLEIRKDMFG